MLTDNKQMYKQFCISNPEIPIFMQDWWLDVVCGKSNWDVALVTENGFVRAAMPYPIKKKYGLIFMLRPPLTPHMGPWIIYPDELNESKRIGYEHKIYKRLIEKLSKYTYFEIGFNPQVINWQAFHWSGFKQTTRYTYIIPPNKAAPDKKTRWTIKNASKQFTIQENDNLRLLYELQNQVFARQDKQNPLSFSVLQKLDTALSNKSSRKILFASDNDGIVHAGVYLIWDARFLYLLMSGTSNKHRNTQANTLLVNESIKMAHQLGLTFNFEGSMIESIEKFNRHFSPIQLPYFYLTKTNSVFIKCYHFFSGKS